MDSSQSNQHLNVALLAAFKKAVERQGFSNTELIDARKLINQILHKTDISPHDQK